VRRALEGDALAGEPWVTHRRVHGAGEDAAGAGPEPRGERDAGERNRRQRVTRQGFPTDGRVIPHHHDQITPGPQGRAHAAQERQRIHVLDGAVDEGRVERRGGERSEGFLCRHHRHVEPGILAQARVGAAAIDDAEHLPVRPAVGEHRPDRALAVVVERVGLGLDAGATFVAAGDELTLVAAGHP
jgi:hypothetical protein